MVRRAPAVLGLSRRRALALAGLTAAVAVYTAGAGHLWEAGLWPDVLFLALVVPDIDTALDEAPAKTAFWNAFKAVGAWYAELPPY